MIGWVGRRGWRIFLLLLFSPLFLLRAILERVIGRELLVLRLSGAVPDTREADPFWRRFVPRRISRVSLEEILIALEEAALDAGVKSILLMLDRAALSLVQAEELVAAIGRVSAANKKVLVWADGLNAPALVVSAGADQTFGVPEGQLAFFGIRARAVFVHDLLELLGVVPELDRHGDYKTMADMFNHQTMSEAQREMLTDLGGDLNDQILTPLVSGRGPEREAVAAALDDAPVSNQTAIEQKLLDGVAYRDQLEAKAGELAGIEGDPSPCYLPRMLSRRTRREWLGEVFRDLPRVRVFTLKGTIISGEIGRGCPSLATVKQLDAARQNKRVKAVVLRIDSPGGSALASDEIWRAVKRLDEEKPVVASLGTVAASGGYYIAVGARTIFAHSSSITGSIGVVSGKFHVGPALHRWGVRVEGVPFGARAGMYDPDRGYTDGERAANHRELMRFYDVFVDRVAKGRGKTTEEIDAVAQGRVYTGRRAQALGLVDTIGGLGAAVEQARQLAKVPAGGYRLEVVDPSRRGVAAYLDTDAHALVRDGLEALSTAALLSREPALAYCPWRVDGI